MGTQSRRKRTPPQGCMQGPSPVQEGAGWRGGAKGAQLGRPVPQREPSPTHLLTTRALRLGPASLKPPRGARGWGCRLRDARLVQRVWQVLEFGKGACQGRVRVALGCGGGAVPRSAVHLMGLWVPPGRVRNLPWLSPTKTWRPGARPPSLIRRPRPHSCHPCLDALGWPSCAPSAPSHWLSAPGTPQTEFPTTSHQGSQGFPQGTCSPGPRLGQAGPGSVWGGDRPWYRAWGRLLCGIEK